MAVWKNKINIPIKVLFVDESQDTVPLQDAIYELWVHEYNKEKMYLAGDDDQEIYSFGGASLGCF